MKFLLRLILFILGMLLILWSIWLVLIRKGDPPSLIVFSTAGEMTILNPATGGIKATEMGYYPQWFPNSAKLLSGQFGRYSGGGFPSDLDIATYPYHHSQNITLQTFPYSQEEPQISPDGRWIAFFAMEGMDEAGAFYMSADGRQIYLLADHTNDMIAWSPSGRWLAFDHHGQLYRVRPDSSAPLFDPTKPLLFPLSNAEILFDSGDITTHFVVAWVDEETLLAIATSGNYVGGYIYLIRNYQITQLTDQTIGISTFLLLSPDRKLLLFNGNHGQLYKMQITDRRITPFLNEGCIIPVGWSADNEWIIAAESCYDVDGFVGGLYRIHNDSGQSTRLTNDDMGGFYGATIAFSPDRKWVIFARSRSSFNLYRVRTDQGFPEPLWEGEILWQIDNADWSSPIEMPLNLAKLVKSGIGLIFLSFLPWLARSRARKPQ